MRSSVKVNVPHSMVPVTRVKVTDVVVGLYSVTPTQGRDVHYRINYKWLSLDN